MSWTFLLHLIKKPKRIVQIMESAVKLEIPNKVDYEAGKNWGEIH